MEKTKLSPITVWIGNSINIYSKKQNLIYLSKFALLSLILSGIFYALSFFEFGSNPQFDSKDPTALYNFLVTTPNFLAYIIFSIVGNVLFGTWLYVATIHAASQVYSGKMLGVKQTLRLSLKRLIPLVITNLLMTILLILGAILLVIPALVFLIWFCFAQYFSIIDGFSPIESLKKSRELIRGYFWQVAIRLVVAFIYTGIIGILLSLVLSIVGGLLVTMIYPYFYLVPLLIWFDLKKIKKSRA